MLLLPWLLFAAAFTIWSNPKEDSLRPYHLISTALNIEASKFANRRGPQRRFLYLQSAVRW